MDLDFSRFKKLSEDKRTATFQHPLGHKITVAKHVLSPGMRGEISKLPLHLADGGDVADENTQDPSKLPQQPTIVINTGNQPAPQGQPPISPDYNNLVQYYKDSGLGGGLSGSSESRAQNDLDRYQSLKGMDPASRSLMQDSSLKDLENRIHPAAQAPSGATGTWEAPPSNAGPNMPMMPQAPEAPPSTMPMPAPTQAVQDPYAALNQQMMAGPNEMIAGAQNLAKAEGDLGNKQADIWKQNQTNIADQQKTYDQHVQDLAQDIDHSIHDLKEGFIKPEQYWNNMSTPGKITTGIGLMFGAFGAGMLHQTENPVMKMLNDDINRDVAAQESNQGTRKSLLQANFNKFNNNQVAAEFTKAQQWGIVASKINEAAARSQSPIAQARAQQLIGQIKTQYIDPSLKRVAAQQMLNGSASDPAQKIQMMETFGMIPKDQANAARKEIGASTENNDVTQAYLESFDKLHNDTVLNGTFSPNLAQSEKNFLAGKIVKATEGRYNFEAAQQMVQSLYPNRLESNSTSMQKRQNGLQLLGTLNQTPTLDGLRIKIPTTGKYDEFGQLKPEFKMGPPVLNGK